MTQHVPLPLKRPQRLDHGQFELEFRWEPFSAISREFLPLLKRHWQELARDQDRVLLDPDWDTHFGSELQGKLHVLTAREGSQLRGYIFNFIGGALNYNSTCHGHTEKYWLEPAFRKGWLPVRSDGDESKTSLDRQPPFPCPGEERSDRLTPNIPLAPRRHA